MNHTLERIAELEALVATLADALVGGRAAVLDWLADNAATAEDLRELAMGLGVIAEEADARQAAEELRALREKAAALEARERRACELLEMAPEEALEAATPEERDDQAPDWGPGLFHRLLSRLGLAMMSHRKAEDRKNRIAALEAEVQRLRKCVKEEWDGIAADLVLRNAEADKATIERLMVDNEDLRKLVHRLRVG